VAAATVFSGDDGCVQNRADIICDDDHEAKRWFGL
jgi:hypothetical protein